MSDLQKAREIINYADSEMAKLFEMRMDAVKLVTAYKKEKGIPVDDFGREAEMIVRQAQEQAAKLVEQEAIFQEAKRQCQEMILQTQTRTAELRKVSNDYMDDALRRTEEAIAMSLEDVKDTRAKFKALVEAQEKRAAISVAEDVE